MKTLEKTIAVSLQAASALLFVAAGFGARADDVFVLVFGVPAVASMVGGLLLWGRSVTAPQAAAAAAAPAAPAPVPAKPVQLSTEEVLMSLQEEVSQLREDRRFYQELYSEKLKTQQLA